MINAFRKLLIRVGKIMPFMMCFILMVNYTEIIHSITHDVVYIDMDGFYVYATPFSNAMVDFIYIDCFDVMMVWILCVALELCKYAIRCAWLITLNLGYRLVVERFEMDELSIITLTSLMLLFSIFCLYGGIKMAKKQMSKI